MERRLSPTQYYPYNCSLEPHPFMGLGKFVAGRIYQIQARKSYLAAHPSRWSEDPVTLCPRCLLDEETFDYVILTCPARSIARNRLLGAVSSIRRTALYGPTHPSSPRSANTSQLPRQVSPRTWFPPPPPHHFAPPHPPYLSLTTSSRICLCLLYFWILLLVLCILAAGAL